MYTNNNILVIAFMWIPIGVVVVGLTFGALILSKHYKVWAKEMDGKAELAEAEWSKQVAIEEAKAEKESAVFKAEADVELAKGVARANEIIADGLKGNEEYLRYLWIENLDSEAEVIYVPTEAGLPILEAGKR